MLGPGALRKDPKMNHGHAILWIGSHSKSHYSNKRKKKNLTAGEKNCESYFYMPASAMNCQDSDGASSL